MTKANYIGYLACRVSWVLADLLELAIGEVDDLGVLYRVPLPHHPRLVDDKERARRLEAGRDGLGLSAFLLSTASSAVEGVLRNVGRLRVHSGRDPFYWTGNVNKSLHLFSETLPFTALKNYRRAPIEWAEFKRGDCAAHCMHTAS